MKLFLLVLIPQLCLQAFDYRENSPASLFNQLCAITDPSPLGNLSNPSYLPFWNGYYLHGSYGKPYMLDELNAGTARTGYCRGGLGIQAGWSSFGMEEYREQTLEGSLGLEFFRFLSMGAGCTAYNLRIDTDECSLNSWMSDLRTAVTVSPAKSLRFSFLQENIISLFDHRRRDLLYPGWSAGCDLSPLEGLHLTWNLNRGFYGYENLVSVSVNLLVFLTLRAGYARESSATSMALVLFLKNMRISYGMRYHGVMGTTHSMGLSLAGGALGVSPLRFQRPARMKAEYDLPEQPVDITRCTRDELRALPGVNDDIARRLILFRDSIGPVTLKTLYQVGLEEHEVLVLQQCLTGLAPDPDGFKRRAESKTRSHYNKTGYDTSRRKILFARLLKDGIPSGTAIRIADMARTHRLESLIPAIRGMDELSPHLREKIILACTDTLR